MDFVNQISRWIAGFILALIEKTETFWEHLLLARTTPIQVVIDILLISILFYWLIMLIKGTRTLHILTGLIILGSVFLVSLTLNLVALNWILNRFLTMLLVAIPVIFQPELRRGLEKLGQARFFARARARELDVIINQVLSAADLLAEQKQGALMVFQREDNLQEYLETGIPLEARVSKELLGSIFNAKGPLHDGAVIIKNNRILAASCILPLSYKEMSSSFGTRHKAGLGLAENTDAVVLIISEEKGSFALAANGHLQADLSLSKLQILLKNYLKPKSKKS